MFAKMMKTRQPVVMNTLAELVAAGGKIVPGTDTAKAMASVPILGGDRVLGAIILENHERENAFGDAEVRLLSTVAASMGVALENARLFDETQRLLKETEQRAAELAVINSVQEGMAAELDFQAIVDLVGTSCAKCSRPAIFASAGLIRNQGTCCSFTNTSTACGTIPARERRFRVAPGTRWPRADSRWSLTASAACNRIGHPPDAGNRPEPFVGVRADPRQRPPAGHNSYREPRA
jgi:hypothetical protein